MNGQTRLERHLAGYESATTVMSSELETTSFCDSDDDDTMSRWASSCHGRRSVAISGSHYRATTVCLCIFLCLCVPFSCHHYCARDQLRGAKMDCSVMKVHLCTWFITQGILYDIAFKRIMAIVSTCNNLFEDKQQG